MPHFSVCTHAFAPTKHASTRLAGALGRSLLADARHCGSRDCNLFLPPEAPAWIRDPDVLWAEVRRAEPRKSRGHVLTISLALPRRVSACLIRSLVEDFVRSELTAQGRAVEAAIRASGRNPIAHLHVTTRRVDAFGVAQRVYPTPDAHQLLAWEQAWNRLCARALHNLLVAAPLRGRRSLDG